MPFLCQFELKRVRGRDVIAGNSKDFSVAGFFLEDSLHCFSSIYCINFGGKENMADYSRDFSVACLFECRAVMPLCCIALVQFIVFIWIEQSHGLLLEVIQKVR